MNHAKNQKIDLFWANGPDLGALLEQAAAVVTVSAGYCEVHSHFDYENNTYEVSVYVYN